MKVYDIHQIHIYASEIWQKSLCLDWEESINQQIFDHLISKGFQATEHPRIWQRNDQTVIVCLVDDIASCGNNYHTDLPYTFDKNTTIITDNYLTCPSQYRVIRVPESFFGIYSHEPVHMEWNPDRLFSFNINRIDYRRFYILLDLTWRNYSDLNNGYVNFNCLKKIGPMGLNDQSVGPFKEMWAQLSTADQEKFQHVYNKLEAVMPFKNYDIDFDLVPYRSWLNIVVETYSSDNNISLSEKIFRALITPAPWTVYSGRYTVAYLESLGFDCLSDLINHNHYDRLKEVENKISVFNWKSFKIAQRLQEQSVDTIRQRCIQAASHNRMLLKKYSEQRDQEFDQWLSTLVV